VSAYLKFMIIVKLDIFGKMDGVSSWPQFRTRNTGKPTEGGVMRSLLKATLAITTVMQIATLSPPSFAQAQQNFPTKPIRFVVRSTPGVGTDSLARMIGEKMSVSWGQPVIVDNRPGAGGMLAGSMVAKATPDGHTLLMVSGFAITAVMQPNLSYDPLKDFAGVTQIGHGTAVLVVAPALGVKSVKELIALTHSQPGKIIYGSGAPGSGDQLAGARFIRTTGIKVINVAFKGSPEATIEVLAGRTHYAFVGFAAALPHIQDRKLLALAVSKRIHVLPEVPALAETLPEFNRSTTSWGLLAPAATPRPVVHQISKEVARILDLPDIMARLPALGLVPATTTPEEYDKIVREQIEIISGLAKDLGLKVK
jgi:tripartite-type tricarboxylate transporter receptor subunit TctC